MRRLRCESGLTIVELLIAAAIAGLMTAALGVVAVPAQATLQAQPEAADMQQRLRVAVDALSHDLMMAGGGSYLGAVSGPLTYALPAILPYRFGEHGHDPDQGVFFRRDAVSVVFVPRTSAQAVLRDTIPENAIEVPVMPESQCAAGMQSTSCGFAAGTRAILIDSNGMWDVVTIATAGVGVLGLSYDGTLSTAYAAGSKIASVEMHTYYLRTDTATNTFALRHYDGASTDLPVVDHVVGLAFEYFGEAAAPALLPDVELTEAVGPWTTYGPKPPPLERDDPVDAWSTGENCTFVRVDEKHVPRLAALGPVGSLVRLEPSMLTDGPWCPDAGHPDRYDADLLRIRRVRVTIRVQATMAALRGTPGVWFTRGGVSTASQRFVPDLQVRFDLTPRNINLGR